MLSLMIRCVFFFIFHLCIRSKYFTHTFSVGKKWRKLSPYQEVRFNVLFDTNQWKYDAIAVKTPNPREMVHDVARQESELEGSLAQIEATSS